MKILIFIGSLQTGGAERVTSLMCNFWCEQGHEVTLVTSVPLGNDFYYLDEKINRVSLGFNFEKKGVISSIIEHARRLRRMKNLIKTGKFEVVIGCTSTLATRVAFFSVFNRTSTKFIGWEHSNYLYYPGKLKRSLRKYLYTKLDSVVLLTKRDVEGYSSNSNLVVIPNPVTSQKNSKQKRAKRINKWSAVAVGSLIEIKGFDRMIEVAIKVYEENKNFTLHIYGGGPKEEYLKELVEQENATDYIKLMGVSSKLPEILFEYDIYLMTSLTEGMPMVILESFSTGLPVVAMDCPTGPKELIGNDQFGRLVENGDIDGFAESVIEVLSSPDEYTRLVESSFKRADDFDIKKIGQSWSQLFDQ